MAYLDNVTHRDYYEGRKFGSYQFCTLDDIINQFMAVYIGEDKGYTASNGKVFIGREGLVCNV